MKKKLRNILCLILLITALIPTQAAYAESTQYTYNYDYYGIEYESPDAYKPEAQMLGSQLGIGDFKNPLGLFVKNDHIFICDSGNNRIVEVDKNFNKVRVIDKVVINGKDSPLSNPRDVFVTDNGDLYICDSDNNRVLHLDTNLNVIRVYTKPEDKTLSKQQAFIPKKCVVDTAGRLYLIADNINKGLMVFDKNGVFAGYKGANKVRISTFEVMQKRLMTKEQRDRMVLFVPTEYSNISIDKDNFLYTTTTTFKDREVNSAVPIRKLNSLGDDILIRNGYYKPIGDLYSGTAGGVGGASRFEDVTALDNDTYFALDRVRGRIFSYDSQGNLLYTFGGLGFKFGYFQYPIAIDHMGTDLVVLDSQAGSITRFSLTNYGSLIVNGLKQYKLGRYDESAKYWKEVIKLNGNFDMAYIGIGRALLRQERYHEAMKYFKAKLSFGSYSKAFQGYRKEWVDTNVGYIVAVVLALIILPKLIRFIRKLVKGEVFK